jgi:hypothetical protein
VFQLLPWSLLILLFLYSKLLLRLHFPQSCQLQGLLRLRNYQIIDYIERISDFNFWGWICFTLYLNKKLLAHTIQWIGALGVLLIVQTGYVLGAVLGWQSKHSVSSYKAK